MNTQYEETKRVVSNHLQSFVEHKGIDAILEDYDESAVFITDSRCTAASHRSANSSWIS
jgi:hypothetical protein